MRRDFRLPILPLSALERPTDPARGRQLRQQRFAARQSRAAGGEGVQSVRMFFHPAMLRPAAGAGKAQMLPVCAAFASANRE